MGAISKFARHRYCPVAQLTRSKIITTTSAMQRINDYEGRFSAGQLLAEICPPTKSPPSRNIPQKKLILYTLTNPDWLEIPQYFFPVQLETFAHTRVTFSSCSIMSIGLCYSYNNKRRVNTLKDTVYT